MNWSVNKEKLIEKRKPSRKADTIHPGRVVQNQEIELQVLEWVHGQRNHGRFVYTRNMITKVLQINAEFKGGSVNKIRRWI